MKMIKFYDTSSLLLKADTLFEVNERFAISSITLEELEHIKTAANKDANVKFAARRVVRAFSCLPAAGAAAAFGKTLPRGCTAFCQGASFG